MNRKKKIYIGIIIVLTFIISCSLLLLLEFNKKDIKVSENQENTGKRENVNIEDSIDNVIDENTITQNEVSEATTTTELQDTVTDGNVNTTKKVTAENQKQVAQNSKSQVEVVPQNETLTETQDTKKQETQEVNTTETKVETVPEVQETEKYLRNDVMISKIKQVIENNVTDDMKNFGYTIVVDSSIKNKTNQFTFAESRVINAIRLKFGTIRIYAEDYYYNGQLIMTECYIL